MRVAIYGAGAIGAYMGVELALSGVDESIVEQAGPAVGQCLGRGRRDPRLHLPSADGAAGRPVAEDEHLGSRPTGDGTGGVDHGG